MLFHLTMTHTPNDCPGYNREKMPELAAALENIEAVCKELGVKCHFLVEGAPEHVSYALIEADNYGAVLGFVHQIPIRQDFKVTVVQHAQDLLPHIRTMMAQA